MKFKAEIRSKEYDTLIAAIEFNVPPFFAEDSKALADEAWNAACELQEFNPNFHYITAPVEVET